MVLLRNTCTYVWLFLVVATLISWWLGMHEAAEFDWAPLLTSPRTLVFAFVAIAIVKVRFVIWHFMEVGHGPAWLRWTCDAWLVSLGIVMLVFYQHHF